LMNKRFNDAMYEVSQEIEMFLSFNEGN
jgi:hypothetical protein